MKVERGFRLQVLRRSSGCEGRRRLFGFEDCRRQAEEKGGKKAAVLRLIKLGTAITLIRAITRRLAVTTYESRA